MPPEVISEDRVKVIVGRELAQYDREVGNVRHTENKAQFTVFSEELKSLTAVMNELKGAGNAIKLLGGFIAALCTLILMLLTYLGTHPVAHSALAIHENVVLSQNATQDMR